MNKRIAIYGLNANPPGNHHVAIVKALTLKFDLVYVVPSGGRPDKSDTECVKSVHRGMMSALAFCGIPKVIVDFSDVNNGTFTPTVNLGSRYEGDGEGEVRIVVGADIVKGGWKGESQIEMEWKEGEWIWEEANLTIIKRPDYDLSDGDLPPNGEVIEMELSGSSTEIRRMIGEGKTTGVGVPASVMDYMVEWGLYRV